ncbi:alpha/beta hydrolase family protein [Nocardioides rotundus]|uniref:alpha/beta hydrolase n=1 Tax=Nocardioides rotundus TaxID=1774216 RepID=UPI001CBF13A3|nr:alpha/beta hydrolase [Nocardioides rotundus]UAL29761.1 alpha/beta hydrolase family protein [Nocardioides rotundus]
MSTSALLPELHYEPIETDGLRLLACDPPGGPRIVEALGDIAMADHIAVLVPGNGHHRGNYLTHRGPVGPRGRGRLLLPTMQALAPGARVAVVVWVGYRAPSGIAAAFSNGPAYGGAGDLARLTHYLPRSAHVTLIGHSYGAAVCGLALADGRADDCVALGAPGMGVWRRAELGERTRLWAGAAASDWIRLFPHGRIGRLGLGRSPLHPAIGARRFATGDVTGHCGYYAEGSESLRNIALIAVGRYDEASPVEPVETTALPVEPPPSVVEPVETTGAAA